MRAKTRCRGLLEFPSRSEALRDPQDLGSPIKPSSGQEMLPKIATDPKSRPELIRLVKEVRRGGECEGARLVL